jgi:hypothetical protein
MMGCLGVHFALGDHDLRALRSQASDQARLDYLQNQIEEIYMNSQKQWCAETDKAWDAIHRALTDGRLSRDNGTFPLSHVILGGESLYEADDYIMRLKSAEEVQAIARALRDVREDEFRTRYYCIDPDNYGMPLGDEDFRYTWEYFTTMREFFQHAAKAGRCVLFTASQ